MTEPETKEPLEAGPAASVLNAAGEFEVHDEAVDLSHYRIEDWISFAIFWMLALVIFYQFFTRYALNDSASWTEEIARYLLIATAFVGAAMNVRKNNHIQVDFLYRFLPHAAGRALSTAVDVLRILFFGYCVGLTWLLTQKIGSSRMAIIDWPIGIVYACVGVGFALMTWRALDVGWANWRRGASVLERPELADEIAEPPAWRGTDLRTFALRAAASAAAIGVLWLAAPFIGKAYGQLSSMAGPDPTSLWFVIAICFAHWTLMPPAAARAR